jgi:hypothetical protein
MLARRGIHQGSALAHQGKIFHTLSPTFAALPVTRAGSLEQIMVKFLISHTFDRPHFEQSELGVWQTSCDRLEQRWVGFMAVA